MRVTSTWQKKTLTYGYSTEKEVCSEVFGLDTSPVKREVVGSNPTGMGKPYRSSIGRAP